MVESNLIAEMALVLAISSVVMVIFHRARQPTILGCLIAGVIVGPLLQPILRIEYSSITLLAEMGVIFLMFSVGLEFNLDNLRKVGGISMLIAVVEIPIAIAAGYMLGVLFGWSYMDSVFLGAMISISSTTIISNTILKAGKRDSDCARTVVGVLIVEDLAAIVLVTILSSMAMTGTFQLESITQLVLKITLFVCVTLALGIRLVPWAIDKLVEMGPEITAVCVTGMCFTLAYFASYLQFSVAIGAFIMGVIISESRSTEIVIKAMNPLRDVFLAVFFVSIGMLLEPAAVFSYAVPIIIIFCVFLVVKLIGVSLGAYFCGFGKGALPIGLTMLALGEFSFVMAREGMSTGVTGAHLYSIMVAVSIATTLLLPTVVKHSGTITDKIFAKLPNRLLVYSNYLTMWIVNFRRSAGRSAETAKQLRKKVYSMLINLMMLILLSMLGGFSYSIARPISGILGLDVNALMVLFAIVTFIAMVPFIRGMIGSTIELIDMATNAVVHDVPSSIAIGKQTVHRVIRDTTVVVVFIGGTVTLLPLLSTISSCTIAIIAAFVILGVCVVLLWSSINALHERIEGLFFKTFMGDQSKGEGLYVVGTHDEKETKQPSGENMTNSITNQDEKKDAKDDAGREKEGKANTEPKP